MADERRDELYYGMLALAHGGIAEFHDAQRDLSAIHLQIRGICGAATPGGDDEEHNQDAASSGGH